VDVLGGDERVGAYGVEAEALLDSHCTPFSRR
jgi:hypothetical protein